MVRKVIGASRACFASFAASVERRLEVFARVVECRGWLVFCAGRASVWPSFRRTFVAQAVALSVLPQVAELEGSAAPAASFELVLLCLVASLADV